MKISASTQSVVIRLGGLAFALIMLWSLFRPIGYAWSEHAGMVLDGLLVFVNCMLAMIQIWRIRRDLRAQKGANDAR